MRTANHNHVWRLWWNKDWRGEWRWCQVYGCTKIQVRGKLGIAVCEGSHLLPNKKTQRDLLEGHVS